MDGDVAADIVFIAAYGRCILIRPFGDEVSHVLAVGLRVDVQVCIRLYLQSAFNGHFSTVVEDDMHVFSLASQAIGYSSLALGDEPVVVAPEVATVGVFRRADIVDGHSVGYYHLLIFYLFLFRIPRTFVIHIFGYDTYFPLFVVSQMIWVFGVFVEEEMVIVFVVCRIAIGEHFGRGFYFRVDTDAR